VVWESADGRSVDTNWELSDRAVDPTTRTAVSKLSDPTVECSEPGVDGRDVDSSGKTVFWELSGDMVALTAAGLLRFVDHPSTRTVVSELSSGRVVSAGQSCECWTQALDGAR
jgi:hypothetical protein